MGSSEEAHAVRETLNHAALLLDDTHDVACRQGSQPVGMSDETLFLEKVHSGHSAGTIQPLPYHSGHQKSNAV